MKLGLQTNKSKNNKYLNIYEGTFRLKVDNPTENTVSRVNKNGETVNELVFESVAGNIHDMYIKPTDYGTKFNMVLNDGESNYYIQLGYADYMALAIYKMLPNVNPHKPVKVSLSRKADETGKERTSIFMSQDDEKGREAPIKHKYTKANPEGLPELEEIIVKGQKQKDNTKQVEFLVAKVVQPFIESLESEPEEEIENVEVETSGFAEVPEDGTATDPFNEDKPF